MIYALFYASHPFMSVMFFGLLLLLWGSVLNVIIYRLPLMLNTRWTTECESYLKLPLTQANSSINLFFPRSFCPRCNTKIPYWHNVPVLSYCLLHGKCHACRQAISSRYPLIECIYCVLGLLAWLRFGLNPTCIAACVFISFMLCLTCIDAEWQLLPDELTLSLLWLGLLINTQAAFVALPDAVWGATGGYLSLWSIMQMYAVCTGKIGMGHGDFKLFAALGAWYGWAILPYVLVIAALLGTVFGAYSLLFRGYSRHTPIPFGPFLCASGLCALFLGPEYLQNNALLFAQVFS